MRDFYRGLAKFLGVTALILGITVGILYGFFMKIVEIGHNAMAPTLMVGDTIAVWKTNEFELGEMALCAHPSEAGRYVIGRIVARSGQTVEVDGSGNLTINGQPPDRDLHGDIQWNDAETGRQETVRWADETILDSDYRYFWTQGRARGAYRGRRLTGGGYFLLSDNRLYRGEDSRTFGLVRDCIGRPVLRLVAGDSPPEIGNKRFDLLE